jgi:hypothetical protein
MSAEVTHRTAANGGPAAVAAEAAVSREYTTPPTARSMTAQVAAMLSVLAGLWVAISPWFIVLQQPSARNATVGNLIIGLAVAGLAVLASCQPRGFLGLESANALLGVWLIISPFILSAKYAIQPPMYWSNIWSGGVLIALSLIALGMMRRQRA